MTSVSIVLWLAFKFRKYKWLKTVDSNENLCIILEQPLHFIEKRYARGYKIFLNQSLFNN